MCASIRVVGCVRECQTSAGENPNLKALLSAGTAALQVVGSWRGRGGPSASGVVAANAIIRPETFSHTD
jgi:hypothetical protein